MVICIRDYTTSVCRFTAGKTYKVIYDSYGSIVIEDDDDGQVALAKDDIGMGFFTNSSYHFKYLSEVRDNKLKQLGI